MLSHQPFTNSFCARSSLSRFSFIHFRRFSIHVRSCSTSSLYSEYGVVKLSGLALKERAKAMISIAHPEFREELAKYAEANFH